MNLPNRLTVIRMVLVPVIIAVFLCFDASATFTVASCDIVIKNVIVDVLFCLASITDMLDGQIARKYNLITTFGKFMDPIADKMLVNSMLILLAYERLIPVLCVILMIMRDLVVDAVRLMAAGQAKVIAAGPLGKLKTVTQMVAIIMVLLNDFPLHFLPFSISFVCILLATLISLISGYDYFIKNKDMIFESM